MRPASHAGGLFALAAATLLAAHAWRAEEPESLSTVSPNDNRTAAGTPRGGVHEVTLVVQRARWFPEASDGPSIVVEAFGEEGKAPQVPAPLLRVRTGTTIAATVRNALPDSTVTIIGLQTRPAAAWDTVRLSPGESRTVRFAAGAPGTYLYHAVVGTLDSDKRERETTGGAFVIDSADARPDDRVLVINVWGEPKDSTTYSNAVAINGKSWPHTERLSASLGDSVRYRVVNASIRPHPMHLHGFYFRVDSRGNGRSDSTFAPDARRLAVTERMPPGTTRSLVWHADRPGNWLFHCHLAFHVVPEAAVLEPAPPESQHALSHDAGVHMVGLIMGITVREPRGWREPARVDPEKLRLYVQEGAKRGRAPRAMGYVLQRGDTPPARDSIRIAGPTLVLTRGRPTDITVINNLKEPTAVHWHGIELESWSDGVAGWSGAAEKVAPSIAPGDSFTARLTLPRAGTFMYHTHLGDLAQLTSGLYGAIVVLEPGQRFDPRTDHVFVLGWDGVGPPPRIIVNGDSLPPPLELALGATHRFRFVNIGPAADPPIVLRRDSTIARWRLVAKDGANLPASTIAERPARVRPDVGETYDVEFTPREPGDYRLAMEVRLPTGLIVPWQQRIVVR